MFPSHHWTWNCHARPAHAIPPTHCQYRNGWSGQEFSVTKLSNIESVMVTTSVYIQRCYCIVGIIVQLNTIFIIKSLFGNLFSWFSEVVFHSPLLFIVPHLCYMISVYFFYVRVLNVSQRTHLFSYFIWSALFLCVYFLFSFWLSICLLLAAVEIALYRVDS